MPSKSCATGGGGGGIFSQDGIYRQTCDLQMFLGKLIPFLTWFEKYLRCCRKVIFFHNVYKTSCPQQELPFGVNTQLWQAFQRKTWYSKGRSSGPTGLTSGVHVTASSRLREWPAWEHSRRALEPRQWGHNQGCRGREWGTDGLSNISLSTRLLSYGVSRHRQGVAMDLSLLGENTM